MTGFALYADNVHRHGTPAMPKRYFKALLDVFGSDCGANGGSARWACLEQRIELPIFRDEKSYPITPATISLRAGGCNDFKYWELMRRATERGIKVFDYGRSKQGYWFVLVPKNWGFEPKALHYEYCLYRRDGIPQNNPTNAK